jgi:hypothetical protein
MLEACYARSAIASSTAVLIEVQGVNVCALSMENVVFYNLDDRAEIQSVHLRDRGICSPDWFSEDHTVFTPTMSSTGLTNGEDDDSHVATSLTLPEEIPKYRPECLSPIPLITTLLYVRMDTSTRRRRTPQTRIPQDVDSTTIESRLFRWS